MTSDPIGQQERVFTQNILFSDGVPCYADETVEDLQRSGLRLLQKKQGFRFGTDSVLLAAYAASLYAASPHRSLRAADLGAGCGAVTLLLGARLPGARILGIESDCASVDVLRRNIALNSLGQRVTALQADIRTLAGPAWPLPDVPRHQCDLVVANPPYRLPGHGVAPAAASRRQAREESSLPLEDVFCAAANLLAPGGRLVLVHQAQRLPDVLRMLPDSRFEAKTLRPVQSLSHKAPAVFLLSAVYRGRPGGFRLEKPLLIQSRPGVLDPETANWYGNEDPLPAQALDLGLIRHPGIAPDCGGDAHGDKDMARQGTL